MKVYKWINLSVALVMLVSFFVVSQPAQALNSNGARPEGDYMPGELVVVYEPGVQALDYTALSRTLEADHGVRTMKVSPSGAALVAVDESRSLDEVKDELQADPSVELVEYNYIYSIPDLVPTNSPKLTKDFVLRPTAKGLEKEGVTAPLTAIPQDALRGMKSVRSGRVQATYPTDPYLWLNQGWSWVGADIVWPNTTASAGVCVLDTGVDYLHPDLTGRIVKGYDFVNGDADPMDDFGHGTHVAGIITAVHNNAKGMAGASNAKVVAVKVLGAQGWGTSYDIASGINFCANRTDVKVLNLSLGGPHSVMIQNAVDYAVNIKNKLVVAAAGNNNTNDPTSAYPAALSTTFPDKVLAVAASGMWTDPDGTPDTWDEYNNYRCKADYSNYGDWVSVVAPGTDILSTTPWDKPFYMNIAYGVPTRYANLSGTSMATPFVAAAAARRWGYKPIETNVQVAGDLKNPDLTENWIYADDGTCWPAEMPAQPSPDLPNTVIVNVAGQLERGGATISAYDATTTLPLNGATVTIYKGTSAQGSAVITPYIYKADPYELDPSRIYTEYTPNTDIINLPLLDNCTTKINKSGFTSGFQSAYQQNYCWTYRGGWVYEGRTAVPQLSKNFDIVPGWWRYTWDFNDDGTWTVPVSFDLDQYVWIPEAPNPMDISQPAPFIVGGYAAPGGKGRDYGYLEGDPSGAMTGFPFARWKNDGMNAYPFEDTSISSRLAHAPLAANTALPYYPGWYDVIITDYGQMIDHDENASTPDIPVMGIYDVPWVYIWKDGVIKGFNAMDVQSPGGACNTENWHPFTIYSGISGAVSIYNYYNDCGDGSFVPYMGAGRSNVTFHRAK